MTLHYGMAVQRNDDETGTEPLDFRKDIQGLFLRAGALFRGTATLVQGTAGWGFQLDPAWYVTERAAGDGFQLWGNDGAITVDTGANGDPVPTSAPGSGLQRWYRIWVRHRSNGENGDGTSMPDAGVEWSAAASSPTLPPLPAGATEVARNLMTSAATSTSSAGNTLTTSMPWTALRGGIVPVRTTDELSALATLGSLSAPIYADLAGALYRCTGTGSAVVVAGRKGRSTVTTAADGRATITHGLGRTPTGVICTLYGNADGGSTIPSQVVVGTSTTATTFPIRVFTAAGTVYASASITVAWEVW